MELILLEPVRKLGNTGEKVKVKNGFARNYLIPRGIALRVNKENLAIYETRKAEIQKNNAAKKTTAEATAKKLEGAKITIIRQAAEDGRLFGSVTAKEIAINATEKGFGIDSKEVELLTPIKAVGIYKVKIALHVDVATEITVNIARTESEADNLFAAELKAKQEAEKEAQKQSA